MAYNGPKSKNRRYKKKGGKDKQQDRRIRDLEKFVSKTIENKQVNYSITATSINSGGYTTSNFSQITAGPQDGVNFGDEARIGNTVTFMKQTWGLNFVGSSTDTFNQMRVLIVETVAGNNALALSDVLHYSNYATFGDNIFSSPYTTKTNTNKRYKVHYDKTFTLSGLPTKGGCSPTKTIKHVIKWPKGKVIQYQDASNSVPTNYRMNLFVISDSVSATHPTMSYNVRTTYKDA